MLPVMLAQAMDEPNNSITIRTGRNLRRMRMLAPPDMMLAAWFRLPPGHGCRDLSLGERSFRKSEKRHPMRSSFTPFVFQVSTSFLFY
jgi:hypothetical protein